MSEGPFAIGGTGGSGTRVFARMARAGGLYIGQNLNESEDQLDFAGFSDRWISRWVVDPRGLGDSMRADLEGVVARHLEDRPEGSRWGWKEPRSAYLLPFFDSVWERFRFVHVVRDGRDMAFSKHQNQLHMHGAALLGDDVTIEPRNSIALWALVNEAAADFGETRMGSRYLRLRFEDLLDDPPPVIGRFAEFLGADSDPIRGSVALERPPALGAWRSRDSATIAGLERIAGATLARFGYV